MKRRRYLVFEFLEVKILANPRCGRILHLLNMHLHGIKDRREVVLAVLLLSRGLTSVEYSVKDESCHLHWLVFLEMDLCVLDGLLFLFKGEIYFVHFEF